MLLQDLTRKLEEINKQKLEIKNKSKELSKETLENRVLEVCLEDLLNELRNLTGSKKVRVDFSALYAPSHCANKIELAKLWIQNRNPKIHITISCDYNGFNAYAITQNFADLRLDNGDSASEHIYLNYVNIGLLNGYRHKVMLNIDPFDKQLNNDIFAQAVYNCVKKRELDNSFTKHS